MLKRLQYLILLFSCPLLAQNIQVDSQLYTAQQLIEDILIDSDCITDITVTNVVGGNFSGTDESYGYFDGTGTTFPFQRGIVLSTGRLENTQGPNTSLSDDDAPDWSGDSDLEQVLGESNTTNATIIEFDFISTADEITFRYIFASEEYQENDASTCQYSDLFGFLIRPVTETEYTNIALVPGTNTPVKVTTVHPEIPGECQEENEAYFESFNGAVSPINFNGQTKVLNATASIVPNATYHVKLVIADEQNHRYDSAVFLEAGSFRLSTNLGEDRLLANSNPLCENDTLELDATQAGNNTYEWYKDGVLLTAQTSETYTVEDTGYYTVEVTLENNCKVYGNINVEYAPNPIVFDTSLTACDYDQDGLTIYDLSVAKDDITGNDGTLTITNFFLNETDAIDNDVSQAITIVDDFENTVASQVVFARVESQFGCVSIAEVSLEISTVSLVIPPYELCDDEDIDGFTSFNLDDITATFQSDIPVDAIVTYYLSIQDVLDGNSLTSPYKNSVLNSETLFVKVESGNQCFALTTVDIVVLETPLLYEDEQVIYCENIYPNTITLGAKLQSPTPEDFTYQWYFNDTLILWNLSEIEVNEVGTYKVVVTALSGCESEREIEVIASSIPVIDDVITTQGTYNNTVNIQASGSGVYEYSMDGSTYQESPIFENVLPGLYTVYVRDTNDCGMDFKEIAILGFPRFFTPNEDGIHDFWQVLGVNAQFNQQISIQIFDRFGKIITQFTSTDDGWNGTYNNEKLPSSDYWFVATLPDGKVYRGHFALKR